MQSIRPGPASDFHSKAMRFLKREWRMHKYIYLMSLPVLAFFIIFRYLPMYGVVIAFKQFSTPQRHIGQRLGGHEALCQFLQ